jgi:hypothetical protein
MSEADFIRLAQAYRRSTAGTVADILNIWTRGSTNPDLVSIDFFAADFVLVTVEVLS